MSLRDPDLGSAAIAKAHPLYERKPGVSLEFFGLFILGARRSDGFWSAKGDIGCDAGNLPAGSRL